MYTFTRFRGILEFESGSFPQMPERDAHRAWFAGSADADLGNAIGRTADAGRAAHPASQAPKQMRGEL